MNKYPSAASNLTWKHYKIFSFLQNLLRLAERAFVHKLPIDTRCQAASNASVSQWRMQYAHINGDRHWHYLLLRQVSNRTATAEIRSDGKKHKSDVKSVVPSLRSYLLFARLIHQVPSRINRQIIRPIIQKFHRKARSKTELVSVSRRNFHRDLYTSPSIRLSPGTNGHMQHWKDAADETLKRYHRTKRSGSHRQETPSRFVLGGDYLMGMSIIVGDHVRYEYLIRLSIGDSKSAKDIVATNIYIQLHWLHITKRYLHTSPR